MPVMKDMKVRHKEGRRRRRETRTVVFILVLLFPGLESRGGDVGVGAVFVFHGDGGGWCIML